MFTRLHLVTLAVLGMSVVANATTATCTTTSKATIPTVIELYTSEGCSSCPPADQWLSQTVAQNRSVKVNNVIALAFHVDYWDYIGWKDAFAQPAFSQRQSTLAQSGGASGVYTPQVFVNGKDDRSWTRGGSIVSNSPASVKFSVTSQWQSDAVVVNGKFADANSAIRLRYAVTENGLVSAVKAGENKGETLRHDAVVRAYGTLTADASGAFSATVRVPGEMRRNTSMLHVIAEDSRGNPVAAATLSCVL
ncbi:MAG: DUF1223 domain-containing protein [Casimicrobium sp.]